MPKKFMWFGLLLLSYLAVCLAVHLALYRATLELSAYRTMIASISGRIHQPMSQFEIEHLSTQVSKIEFGGDLRPLGVNFDAKPLAYYLEPATFDVKASVALLNENYLRIAQVKFDSLSSKISTAYARRLLLLGTLSMIAGAVGLLLLLVFLWQWKRASGHLNDEIAIASDLPADKDLSNFDHYLESVVAEEVKFSGHRALLSCKGFDAEHIPIRVRDAAELIAEQLVRNSILHGGLPAEQRLLAGKTDYLSVRATMVEQDASWVVSVWDNGEGLDGSNILSRARSLRLLDSVAADSLAPEQRIKLVFLPGFTTRDNMVSIADNDKPLSELRAISKRLKGAISVQNQPGQYCQFSVRFPKS
jgi:hypothetical protein